jgi:hypothetical protein
VVSGRGHRGRLACRLQGPAIFDGWRRSYCRLNTCPGTRRLADNFARRHRAYDVWLDDKVGGPADHQKMLYVVAADQDQSATSVNGCCINNG